MDAIGSARLDLVRTRLRIVDDEIIRLNEEGGVVMRMDLKEVKDIRLKGGVDPIGAFFVAVGVGLAVVAAWVAESEIADVLLYSVAIISAGFGLFGMQSVKIVIRTSGGDVHVANVDQADEAEGFVASARVMLSM